MTDLFVLYEHPEWFRPLFAALDRRRVDYEAHPASALALDPDETSPPAPVILNRIAMSSFMRSDEHPIFFTIAALDQWARRGARVINGAAALSIDSSKARQLSLISALGLATPKTRIVHRREDMPAAASALAFPILVKANIGGSGAGIVRYDNLDDLREAACDGSAPKGVDGVSLLQEYAPVENDRILRLEVLDGRLLYAVFVTGAGATFDLCPADACLIQPGKPKITLTETTPPPLVAEAAIRIAAAGGFDICGIEAFQDSRDGVWRFYDVNGLSNFVASPLDVLGWDPHDTFVDYLIEQIEQHRDRRRS